MGTGSAGLSDLAGVRALKGSVTYSALHNSVNTPIFLAPALELPVLVGPVRQSPARPTRQLSFILRTYDVTHTVSVSVKKRIERTGRSGCPGNAVTTRSIHCRGAK